MRVTRVSTVPVSVPGDPSLRTSRAIDGASPEATYDHVIVRIETDTGVTGFGEVATVPDWPGGIDQSRCVDVIDEDLAPVVEGRRLPPVVQTAAALTETRPDEPFTRAGIEIGLLDALGQTLGLPLYDLLGGPTDPDRSLRLHHTIGQGPPTTVTERAREAASAGFKDFKLKVGVDLKVERETVLAVREAVPDARIRVDANGRWDRVTAIKSVQTLDTAANGLVFVEQPVPADDLDALGRVTEETDPPVLADESCAGPTSVATLARETVVDGVNLKVATAGGVGPAVDAGTIASAHGLSVVVGGMLELGIGTAASAHLCLASPAVTFPTGILVHDAVTALLANADDWTPSGSTLTVPDEPGLGVTLDEDALDRYRID